MLLPHNKSLENNFTLSLENFRTKEIFRTNESTINVAASNGTILNHNTASIQTNDKKQHNVVIFHDSLCKEIKDTIMVNENVTTIKTWAPYLKEIQQEVEEMEKVDTIVIESLT